MAAKKGRGARVSSINRKHFCPECSEPVELIMRMPGKALWGVCKAGHENRKSALILK